MTEYKRLSFVTSRQFDFGKVFDYNMKNRRILTRLSIIDLNNLDLKFHNKQ